MSAPERGEVWLADLGFAAKTRPNPAVQAPPAAHIGTGLESADNFGHRAAMSSVQEIESALTRLPLADLQAVRDWLDDFIEERMEVSPEFTAKIERAKEEIAAGVYSRTRKPEGAP